MASAAAPERKSGKRRVRVVVERKVSAEEYERHKDRMESIGLDPSEPVPVVEDDGFTGIEAARSVQPAPGPRNPSAAMLPTLGIANAAAASTSVTQKSEQAALSSLKRGQKQVSLQRRTIEEQIQAGRHERALARFTEQQEHWEAIRNAAAQKTGRSKEELVVTRSEEHRERVEIMELLDRAVPDEAKSGGHSWYHSLRGEGTRYVQIGNMFSGLHLPIKTHKENYEHEIVRKPLLTELATSRNISGQCRRTWRDDEYLQARLRRYHKRMEELAPGQLELHDTLELEARQITEALPEARSPLEPLREIESILDKAEDAPAEGSSPGEPDVEQPEPPQAGPHLEMSSSKLQYNVRVGELGTQHVQLRSTGTAAVGYEWVLSSPQCCFQESVLPDDPTHYFTCSQTRGRIAPGEETTTLFSFVSTMPGTFTSSWRLQTSPKLVQPAAELALHGAATEADLLLERRQNLRVDLFKDQILHQVEEMTEDVVQSVKLQVPPPPDLSLQVVQERVFEEANAAKGLYYSPHAWSRFAELKIQADELKDKFMLPEIDKGPPVPVALERQVRGRRPITKIYVPPAMPPTFARELGPPSAQQLAADLSRIPQQPEEEQRAGELSKQQVQVELAREVRASKRRPLERSPLWWPAYEAITEIAMAVPDKWAAARKALDLNPLPFVPLADDCTSPAALAQHSELLEKRTELLADPDKEEEAQSAFVQSFAQESFGPVLGNFAAEAEEVSAVTEIQEAAMLSLRDRLHPCLELHTVDTVELGGAVVLYELDLGFLAARTPFTSHMATDNSKKSMDVPTITLEPEEEDQLHKRLQGINALLEGSPLAVLVTAHFGEPMPDVVLAAPAHVASNEAATALGDDGGLPQTHVDRGMSSPTAMSVLEPMLVAAALRMKSLPSLDILLKHISDVCQETATSVEFVSHEDWLGDADSFADKVRNENDEKKVYLLENLSAFPEELGVHRTAPRCVASPTPPTSAEPAHPAPKPGSRGKEGKDGRKSRESREKESAPAAEPPVPPENQKPEEDLILPDLTAVSVRTLPWATREWWAERIFGADLRPEFLVQDSFYAAGRQITTHSGIWLGAPQRIVGPFIERELGAFVEALSLPFGAAGSADVEEGVVAADVGEGQEPPAQLGPLLVVLGGGGFSIPKGDKVFLQKLKLLLGLAKLAQHEKGGLLIALGGELALFLLSYGFGRTLGSTVPDSWQSEAMRSVVKETLREVLRLGATLLLPMDLVCEEDRLGLDRGSEADSPIPPAQDVGLEQHIQTFALHRMLAAMQHSSVSLGMVDGHECFAKVDAVQGTCNLCVSPPLEPPEASAQTDQPITSEASAVMGAVVEAVSPAEKPIEGSPAANSSTEPSEEGVPKGWKVRDIGDATLQALKKALRRSRGVLWNGALGVVEDERWQQGTRAFIASVEKRLTGDDEEEEEEEEDEDEDEDEDDDSGKPQEELDPEIDFEVALAIGSDSAKLLPSLMRDPSVFTFVSQSGEGLLQLLRGEPLPGLIACSEKAEAR